MAKVGVEITYGPDGLEMVSVSGEMLNITPIRKKPIPDWFQPLPGRSGWRGLIAEIHKLLMDEYADLAFAFYGPADCRQDFYRCAGEQGFPQDTEKLKNEIAETFFRDAQRAERNGNRQDALMNFLAAGEQGHTEALFCRVFRSCKGKK